MSNAIIIVLSIAAATVILFFVSRIVIWACASRDGNGVKIKRSFKDVKSWVVNHVPSKRRLIQVYAALLYNANIKGFVSGKIYTSETTKYMCVPGLNCYSCPGAVGACPLGALQNAFAESKTRAPYYVLGILALFGLMLARTVCGFLCPVGLCQELVYKVRTPKLKKSRVTRVLSYFKYILLALAIALPVIYASFDIPLPAFCKYICPAGTFEGAILLLSHPDNAGMFAQLGWQFTWKLSLLVAFVVASAFIYRVFCRFICPLGAIYGFFNKFALIGVTVDDAKCTDCGLCVAHCKMDVKKVGDHECIQCGECISVCPSSAIMRRGSRLFLHGNQISVPADGGKPVTVTAGVISLAGDELKTDSDIAVATDVAVNAENIGAGVNEVNTDMPDVAATAVVTESNRAAAEADKAKTPRKKRGAKFWLEVAAWSAALVVLVAALVFYNFIDAEKPVTPKPPPDGGDDVTIGYNVGDTAPDFTVELYGDGGTFNLYENRGKVTVINFWATWCTPCVEEIPYFNELKTNHPEIDVIAIHGSSTSNVEQFIIRKGWDDYGITFAQDNLEGTKCLTFGMFGGTSLWPMTVIVDGEGKVLYNDTKSFGNYAELENLVEGLLNA